jgi:hypothetical protein
MGFLPFFFWDLFEGLLIIFFWCVFFFFLLVCFFSNSVLEHVISRNLVQFLFIFLRIHKKKLISFF